MLEAYQPLVMSLFKRSFEQYYNPYAVRVTLPSLLEFLAKRRNTLELAKSRLKLLSVMEESPHLLKMEGSIFNL